MNYTKTKCAISVILFSISMLTYLLFRPKTLIVFYWLDYIGLMPVVDTMRLYLCNLKGVIPSCLIYSLPFGLWIISYMLVINVIWREISYQSLLWFWCIPLISFVSEILQYFNIIIGTFDLVDLTVLGLVIILGLIIIINDLHEEELGEKY